MLSAAGWREWAMPATQRHRDSTTNPMRTIGVEVGSPAREKACSPRWVITMLFVVDI